MYTRISFAKTSLCLILTLNIIFVFSHPPTSRNTSRFLTRTTTVFLDKKINFCAFDLKKKEIKISQIMTKAKKKVPETVHMDVGEKMFISRYSCGLGVSLRAR